MNPNPRDVTFMTIREHTHKRIHNKTKRTHKLQIKRKHTNHTTIYTAVQNRTKKTERI
jgi:hypothetical protein